MVEQPDDFESEALKDYDVTTDMPDGGWGQPGWRNRMSREGQGGGRRYVPNGRPPGRPPLPPHERMVPQMLSFLPDQLEWLRAQPQGMSAAARNAVAKAMMEAAKIAASVAPTTGDFE